MKNITCIICPNGCQLTIDENTLNVTGNICPKGKDFAISELTHPLRTITTTVKTTYSDVPVICVKVSEPFPKERIMDVQNEIKTIIIDKPVKTGDIILKNVLNLGIDVIVTSDKLKEKI
ncbi:MAG: DUF1667 domain-containing protein [Erysipelotrichaceae bacterium]